MRSRSSTRISSSTARSGSGRILRPSGGYPQRRPATLPEASWLHLAEVRSWLAPILAEAGIDRSMTYVTNVVKHFKWVPKGKRRLHQKPRASEIEACLPWFAAEMEVIGPRILVCLGATAAQALLGSGFRVTRERGIWLDSRVAEKVLATVHPSSVLRARGSQERESMYAEFVRDLRVVSAELNRA